MAALPRIRSTIVGLGGISFEHLEKLGRLPDVEVAGVCDLSPTLVDAVAERFGVAGRYTSYEEMLAELEPDSVHVLTPPQTHSRLVLGALDAGAHVLVEKPAAPSWDEYAEMRDRALQRGLVLLENLNYRTMPVMEAILAERAEGRLGEVVNVDVSMGLGLADAGSPYLDREARHFAHDLPGGALQNFASHPASVVAALAGAPRVVRSSLRQLNPDSLGPDELRALVDAEHGSGAITLTSHGKPASFTVRVQGTRATLVGDVFAGRLEVERAGSPLTRISGGVRNAAAQLGATAALVTRTATGRNYWYVGFEQLLAGFYDALAGGGELPVPVSEMDATNRLVHELFDPDNRL
jgi:predicted dehydrogenase